MCHKQDNEAQVDSKPEVNYKPIQVVQSKSEKEFMEPSELRLYISLHCTYILLQLLRKCYTNVIAKCSYMCWK